VIQTRGQIEVEMGIESHWNNLSMTDNGLVNCTNRIVREGEQCWEVNSMAKRYKSDRINKNAASDSPAVKIARKGWYCLERDRSKRSPAKLFESLRMETCI